MGEYERTNQRLAYEAVDKGRVPEASPCLLLEGAADMNFRVVVELPASDKGTYTIEGWDALRRHLESLETQGKRWIVTKA